MKAVITGATGFIGKKLVDELLKRGDEVIIVVRNIEKIPTAWNGKVEVMEASFDQFPDLCKNRIENKMADIFFHLAWAGMSRAGRADIELQLKNVRGTYEAILLAERLHCKRFVNAGSIMEYEAMQYLTVDKAIDGMGNIYSSAKIMANHVAKTVAFERKIEYVNLIISNIYGSEELSERFLYTTLKKMLRNEDIKMTSGRQLYDFIYISDAIKAIILAAEKCESNTNCYIGNAKQRLLMEFVQEMKNVLDSNSKLLFGQIPFYGAMLTYKEFDTYKLEKIGFKPEVNFQDGIRKTRDCILTN